MKSRLTLHYHLPAGRMVPHFTSLAAGEALAVACATCGHLSFPPTRTCTMCHGTGFEWHRLSGKAAVLHRTYTPTEAFALVCFDGMTTTALVRLTHDSAAGARGRLVASEPYTGLWLKVDDFEDGECDDC